jgi:hypothetical protein
VDLQQAHRAPPRAAQAAVVVVVDTAAAGAAVVVAAAMAEEWADEALPPVHMALLSAPPRPITASLMQALTRRALQNLPQANTSRWDTRPPRWSARIIIIITSLTLLGANLNGATRFTPAFDPETVFPPLRTIASTQPSRPRTAGPTPALNNR